MYRLQYGEERGPECAVPSVDCRAVHKALSLARRYGQNEADDDDIDLTIIEPKDIELVTLLTSSQTQLAQTEWNGTATQYTGRGVMRSSGIPAEMRVSLLTERSTVQARSTHIRPRKDEGNCRGTPKKCAARSGYETSLLSRCTEREAKWTLRKVPDLVVLRIINETTVVALTYAWRTKTMAGHPL